jgi:hypothetical protein
MRVSARARNTLITLFIIFLVMNVIALTMTMVAMRDDDASLLPPNLGPDAAIGLRLLFVIIGGGVSWFCAQILYKLLVRGFLPPSEACGAACSLMSYLLLVFAAVAFLGAGAWLWLPLLFLIVLCWSTLHIWSVVGAVATVATLIIASGAMIATWLLLD